MDFLLSKLYAHVGGTLAFSSSSGLVASGGVLFSLLPSVGRFASHDTQKTSLLNLLVVDLFLIRLFKVKRNGTSHF